MNALRHPKPGTRRPDRSPESAQLTAPMPGFLRATQNGLMLAVKVQPRASRNEVSGVLGEELRIKVTAPPVDAAANEAVLRFLAETLQCGRNQVELVRGNTSRHKTLKLTGLNAAAVLAKLGPFLANSK